MKLWKKILIGLGVGITLGLVLNKIANIYPQQAEGGIYVIFACFKLVGDIFLNLLQMVVAPLVFCSMVMGIASISDMQKLGRIGGKSLSLYLGTTAIAIVIGLGFAFCFNPGQGALLAIDEAPTLNLSQGESGKLFFLSAIVQVFPSNIVKSFTEGNILQIIVFALFLGVSLRLAGEDGKPAAKVILSFSEIMLRMVNIVMTFSPYGVGASMVWIAGNHGMTILWQLGKFVLAYYLACFFHAIVVYGGIIRFGCKLPFTQFLLKMLDAISCAASTTSSSATLPVTMRCVTKNLKVSSEVAGFVLPLGATVNMNGTAIFQGMAAVFIAQAYGYPFPIASLLLVVVTATFSAVGCAGIPGGGMVTLGSVLSSVGLPIQGIAVLAGIDRLRDMIGTPMNILGDAVVAVYVAATEGEMNKASDELLEDVAADVTS